MGFHDYAPAICDECEAYISVMIDQHGDPALCCACGEDGRFTLDANPREWVDDRATRMSTD